MTQIGRIGTEIQQRKGFASIQQEALLTIMRSADWLRHQISDCLAAHGGDLTYQQYNVLRILRGAGSSGLPTLQIAERMIEHTPGITRMIDRLVKKGLVLRTPSPEDRRQVVCNISDHGLAALAPVDQPIEQLNQQLLSTLSEKNLKQLIHNLDLIRA